MKLNYKKIFFVGTAFFLITLFWQTYDAIIPKILTSKFGMNQFWSGIILALDNILALFMLPLFGTLSDKHKGKRGRRTPFIVFGTVVAAIAFLGLSFIDGIQLTKINDIAPMTDSEASGYEEAMGTLYDADPEITVEGKKEKLSSFISREEFVTLDDESDEYVTLAVKAQQSYAASVTANNKWILALFVGVLLIALLAMATFRSPAVALMPDVTPKPLRSKANAVINLMGAVAGVIILVFGMLFGTGKPKNDLMNYIPVFAVTSGLMLLSLIIFRLKVNEPKLVEEMKEESLALGITEDDGKDDDSEKEAAGTRKLSRGELCSLLFILASVVFWFMGYNAVTSKYSVYASSVLRLDYNLTLIIAQAAAIISYFPAGAIATKIGRKKTILIGVALLGTAFGVASFMRAGSNIWVANVIFIMAGMGWATINVNSYPMVVEMSRGSNVGKYTGYYYTASMAAQTLTPILSGKLMDSISMTALFPYAAIFVALAFVTMLFVRHGDSKKIQEKN